MVEIPSCFDHPGAAFVTLPAGIKFPPPYKKWEDPKNWRTYERASKHGGNVGIVAGNGYIGLDKDNPTAFEGLELPTTTTWETRPGRLGLRFKASDAEDIPAILADHGKKHTHAQLKLFKDGKQCGEVKLQRTYQVIPPSHKFIDPKTGEAVAPGKGDRVDYKLLDSSAPAEISLAKLLADLLATGITFSSKLEQNAAKLESRAKEARQKKAVSDEARTRKIAEAALKSEVALMASAPEGGRNDQLNKSSFALGQFVAIGALEKAEVILELSEMAVKRGLDPEEVRKTIISGLEAGMQHPREITTTDRPDCLTEEDCFLTRPKEKKNGELVTNPLTGEIVEERYFSADHSKKSIEKKFNLAMVKGDEKAIWRFNGQIYIDSGRAFFKNAIYDVAGDKIEPKNVNEVLDRLTASLSLKPVVFNPNPFLFPAVDGVLDLRTGEMRAGKPEDLMTFTYNAHCHHPAADYDKFLFYLASSLPDLRDCLTAIDLITKAVIRIPFDTFAFLIGGGSNGKGVLEKILVKLLGIGRVSATKIEEFKTSHFAAGSLLNKDAWVITEVETVKEAISVIKAVSSGEMLDSDIKYGTSRVQGIPHLLTILDSNKALDFKDPSWGRKRRTLKLDFPYEFGYKPDSRPKDPTLLDKLTSPESLAGILQIIKARAPSLIASRRIYRRKSSEEQEAELDRQRFSLQYFCNDCLTTLGEWREDPLDRRHEPEQLTASKAFELYREYCKLWNVPEPAEKVPFGRYISEKYGVESTVGKDENKKSFRYYPGIFCSKSPVSAHADICVDYSELPQISTDILQIWIGENIISKESSTDTTDKQVFSDLLSKLEAMYRFIQLQENPRNISWEKFLTHLSVVSVEFQKNSSADSEKKVYRCSTDTKSSVEPGSPDIVLQMNQEQETPPLLTHHVDCSEDAPTIGPHPRKEQAAPPKKEAGK